MEANEAHELQEHAEHGAHEATMRPVAFTMSVLAVLVAVTTVLGHRTHTEALLDQNKATDQWNEYQAKKIRSTTPACLRICSRSPVLRIRKAAAKKAKGYADHQAKWTNDLEKDQEKAEDSRRKWKKPRPGDRFDLARRCSRLAWWLRR